MDITPQVINEVEFHQKMRGYDPDEVDDFLERVAVAVGALQDRVRDAGERVTQAERRIAELEGRPGGAAPSSTGTTAATTIEEDAETIRRTLVLAQRTADAAIKDAEEAAQRTLSEAQEQAAAVQREAQEHARQLAADAEAEARRSADETRQRLVSEIITLEAARDSIRADHGILERHVEEQRSRLRGAISDLERILEDPARLRTAPAPELSGVTRPDFLDEELETDEATSNAEPELQPETAAASAAEAEPAVVDLSAPTAEPVSGGVTYTAAEADDAPLPSVAPGFAPTTEEDEAWARFVGEDGGPPTGPIRLDEADDDAYLAELRKAMLDDGGASDPFEIGDDQRRTRFGRRR